VYSKLFCVSIPKPKILKSADIRPLQDLKSGFRAFLEDVVYSVAAKLLEKNRDL